MEVRVRLAAVDGNRKEAEACLDMGAAGVFIDSKDGISEAGLVWSGPSLAFLSRNYQLIFASLKRAAY